MQRRGQVSTYVEKSYPHMVQVYRGLRLTELTRSSNCLEGAICSRNLYGPGLRFGGETRLNRIVDGGWLKAVGFVGDSQPPLIREHPSLDAPKTRESCPSGGI